MGTFTTPMKTHSREDLTTKFMFIHPCVVHKCRPNVYDIVAGTRKEHHYIVTCGHDECSKLSQISPESVVDIWNHYNPLNV